MDGRVLQVNISPGGVPKLPVAAARVERNGLVGDRHDHDTVHGGTHRALDLLDSVERDAWLAMCRAAAEAGLDVRILERGDMAAAASPDLPGSVFNRAFGMRQVPIHRPAMERLFRDAGGPGWLVVG